MGKKTQTLELEMSSKSNQLLAGGSTLLLPRRIFLGCDDGVLAGSTLPFVQSFDAGVVMVRCPK